MANWWKYALVALSCLLIGFSLGYLGDLPNQVTFDATPRLVQLVDDTRADLIEMQELSFNISREDCPIRLQECEKLCTQ